MKKCTRCNEDKGLDDFYRLKNDKFSSRCKMCVAEAAKISSSKPEAKKKLKKRCAKWYRENKDRVKAKYEKNKDVISERNKKRRRENPEEYKRRGKIKFQNRDKEKMNERIRKKYNNDPLVRLSRVVRRGISRVADAVKQQKELRSLEYLGCSLEEFKTHIESLWLDGMTWENHGIDGWHIDHKIPLDYFVKNEDDPWKANHYTNLQPLWAEENIRKGNSI